MSFKKYDGSVWQSITPKQLKGMPYTGTLPAVLAGTKAGYLHKYKIYGNTEQTGTPTPENPIVPSECGERTANLFDEEYPNIVADTPRYRAIYVGDGEFTLSTTTPLYGQSAVLFFLAGNVSSGASTNSNGVWSGQNRTITAINGYVTIAYRYYTNTDPRDYNTMLNTGSTALPYEPYGYKLPLLSGSTPVDIYLGESQTTRRVKKLVLTGEENWSSYNSGASTFFYTSVASSRSSELQYIISSHFVRATISTNNTNVGTQILQTQLRIRPESVASTTTADFKAFLAQQYTNGTPVTVWYVLATEETGILNEPLQKIGAYADTIDSTQTSVQIPTSANSTTISWAGEGLAPSQFDSIQEWVDATTYKRVNGAWVADNSN